MGAAGLEAEQGAGFGRAGDGATGVARALGQGLDQLTVAGGAGAAGQVEGVFHAGAQREVEEASMTQIPRFLRQILAGQLDWMGELSQWTQDGRVRWLSAKVVDDHLLLEGVAQDGAAIEAVAEQIRARYPKPPLSISEVTGVHVAGQTWWRFSMRIEGVDPMHRWILATEPVKVEETAPSADRGMRSFISQMWGMR